MINASRIGKGLLAAALLLAGTPASAEAAAVVLPTVNAQFDYQIGGAYTPRTGVSVVSRDREDDPAPGLYNICYVNAFQTQPIQSEVDMWRQHNLTLKDASGQEVVDGDWNEILLDIGTPAKRQAVAAIVNGWIDGCAADGYQAIEPDNLDSFGRSEGLLDAADAIAYVSLLIEHAHGLGLAIAQKNAIGDPEDGGVGEAGRDAGLDFAVVEECGRYNECPDYQDLYGNHLVVIEYTANGFTRACRAVGAAVSVVRRDTAVRPNGPYDAC